MIKEEFAVKKNYTTPEMDIELFTIQSVMTTSGGENPDTEF